MNLEVIKSKHGYRIISHSTKKHPLLIHLADILKHSNKVCPIKVGVYSITGGEFSTTKRVYSYIADRIEYMNKKKYYKFINGNCSMKPKKPWAKVLKMTKQEKKEIDELFLMEVK